MIVGKGDESFKGAQIGCPCPPNVSRGPLGAELMAAMYRAGVTSKAINVIYGLNGRDMTVSMVEDIYAHLAEIDKRGLRSEDHYNYIGLRDKEVR